MVTDVAKTHDPVRREPRASQGFAPTILAVLSLASSGMLIAAMPSLIATDDVFGWAKLLLIGISAAAAGYAVNRLAIERGAPLAAVGYPAAGVASVASILLVGTGLFAATYAGLVLKDIDALRLQQHGAALARYVGELDRATRSIEQARPVLSAIVGDLKAKSDCEIGTSCVSGRREGGRGPVARLIGEKLGRAEAIAGEVERGQARRKDALRRLSDHLGRYQGAFAHDADAPGRRQALAGIDVQVRQAAADLESAAPVALLRAYAAELATPADAAVSPKLGTILRAHGTTLAALGTALETPSYPAFPARAGVSDTLAFIPHFLPIAAIAMVVELVFPLTLWTYTLLALVWANYRRAPPQPAAPARIDPFHGLLDQRPGRRGRVKAEPRRPPEARPGRKARVRT